MPRRGEVAGASKSAGGSGEDEEEDGGRAARPAATSPALGGAASGFAPERPHGRAGGRLAGSAAETASEEDAAATTDGAVSPARRGGQGDAPVTPGAAGPGPLHGGAAAAGSTPEWQVGGAGSLGDSGPLEHLTAEVVIASYLPLPLCGAVRDATSLSAPAVLFAPRLVGARRAVSRWLSAGAAIVPAERLAPGAAEEASLASLDLIRRSARTSDALGAGWGSGGGSEAGAAAVARVGQGDHHSSWAAGRAAAGGAGAGLGDRKSVV